MRYEMIRINAVVRNGGQVVLTIEYSTSNGNEFVDVDAEQIVDRLKVFRSLLGRRPTQSESKEILVAVIDEVRADKQPSV
jgi:hypothetical protein